VSDDASISVCGRVNERAQLSAVVDDVVGVCDARPLFCCSFALLPGGVADGARTLVVSGVDDAGNLGTASTLVDVDAAPPTLDAIATRIVFRDGSGNNVAEPVPGGLLVAELVFDEALSSGPNVRLDARAAVVGVVGVVDDARVDVVLTLPLDLEPGDHELRLDGVIDLLGHRVDDVLASRLVVPAPAIGCGDLSNECVDGDGDGWRVGACNPALPSDCDDNDAATYPGGFEIPDDGKANDCVGVDDTALLMIADGRAVVVDSADDGVDPDGSLARPFHDVQEADDLAPDDVELLVLLGAIVTPAPGVLEVVVRRAMAGGYSVDDDGALVRGPFRAELGPNFIVVSGRMVTRVEMSLGVGVPITVTDSRLNFLDCNEPVVVARSELPAGAVLSGTGQSVFSEVVSDAAFVLTAPSTIVRSRLTAKVAVSSPTIIASSEVAEVEVDATTVTLVHSLLRADRAVGVSVSDGGAASLINCTVTGTQFAAGGDGVVNADPDPPRTSSYPQAQGGPLLVLDPVAATTAASASLPGARVDLNGRCRVGTGTLGPVDP
jgi:hypothetical protein